MNKWIKYGINITLFFIAFNSLEHFCHKKTSGFFLQRIQFHHETPIPDLADPAILSILNQPFHYLGCGNQCFVFASKDGQHVLKFFKYVDYAPPAWITKVPLLNQVKQFRPKRLHEIAWKRKRDFRGYQLAFDHFRTETGLIPLHLHASQNTYPAVTLYDKLNIVHSLDLNNTPFVLQKRATPVYEQFSSWIKTGDIDKVRQGITDLVSLCAQRISKNIFDDDVHFYSNFGFVDAAPIQVDPGHFILSSSKPEELPALIIELKDWFSHHYPPLASHVEACAR
ncbi:MAG TPA: hypothetical protein VMR37_06985 [Rhabdochlamydiaceae bacterium]|nr:hypothetical protein [Rhabdochlamydiaceae bacterium]